MRLVGAVFRSNYIDHPVTWRQHHPPQRIKPHAPLFIRQKDHLIAVQPARLLFFAGRPGKRLVLVIDLVVANRQVGILPDGIPDRDRAFPDAFPVQVPENQAVIPEFITADDPEPVVFQVVISFSSPGKSSANPLNRMTSAVNTMTLPSILGRTNHTNPKKRPSIANRRGNCTTTGISPNR